MKTELLVLAGVVLLSCAERKVDFSAMKKVDAHVHIDTYDPSFAETSAADNFTLLTIVTGASDLSYIKEQLLYARAQATAHPDAVHYATTFCMDGFQDPDWAARTIDKLEQDINGGAIAVKVWKDIGMTFQFPDGRFIKIDDPIFDPVLNYIAQRNIPLVAHIGEPKNCWLPLDEMTVNGDRNYFRTHPQYHMYLHPEYPSYEELIESRDAMLARHPDLRVIGAHLGSLEWDVSELAKRLDQYPNFAVDLAARICHLKIQERSKVRKFLIAYSDRILYGTDLIIESETDASRFRTKCQNTWRLDWRYFTGDEEMTSEDVDTPYTALALPAKVVKRIFYENAMRWYPGLRNIL